MSTSTFPTSLHQLRLIDGEWGPARRRQARLDDETLATASPAVAQRDAAGPWPEDN